VSSGRGLCDGPIPRPEESYRLWCASECDQVKINNLDTYCEQVGRRGKDCETISCKIPLLTNKWLTNQLTPQNSFWEAASYLAGQELSWTLWNPRVHYLAHKSLFVFPVLSKWIQPTLSHPLLLRSVIIYFYLPPGLPINLFLPVFPTKTLYGFLFLSMRATCPAHLILLLLRSC
jgi:hypothetical protein